uniref:RNA-binding protein 7 isoform X1 n=1 Tax=Myxine glutinosa TaxID=7769 RepID=UPI00358E7C21
MDEANRTLFVGNLEARVTEGILYELFLQGGPLLRVAIAKDKEGKPKPFAFITFKHEESVPYALNLLNGIRLYGRPLKLQFRTGNAHEGMDNCGNNPSTMTIHSRMSPFALSQGPRKECDGASHLVEHSSNRAVADIRLDHERSKGMKDWSAVPYNENAASQHHHGAVPWGPMMNQYRGMRPIGRPGPITGQPFPFLQPGIPPQNGMWPGRMPMSYATRMY